MFDMQFSEWVVFILSVAGLGAGVFCVGTVVIFSIRFIRRSLRSLRQSHWKGAKAEQHSQV